MVNDKLACRRKLKTLLFKLGVKSAGITTFKEAMQGMLRSLNNFGKPDGLMLGGSDLEAYLKAYLKALERDK